jgi:hypothetical protein
MYFEKRVFGSAEQTAEKGLKGCGFQLRRHYLLTTDGTAGSRAPSKLQRLEGFSANCEAAPSQSISDYVPPNRL